jgi:hypothetical protein
LTENNTAVELSKRIEKSVLIPEQPKAPADGEFLSAESLKQRGSASTKTKVSLIAARSSFITIENDTLPKLEQSLKIIRPEETAIIHVTIQTQENYIIQLLDQKYNVVKEILNRSPAKFDNIPPAGYFLRLIIDKNQNGKWDAGNYFDGTPPEPVVYYENESGEKQINLKAHWELGPLLISY